ncbi:MAG: P-loop NTPase [Candidatus Gracilibacteria bacterium]|jgi:ATP-binding protein involved in chromosome partitioning
MLTGQEKISEIIKRFPKAKKTLAQYGLTIEAEEHFKFKNLVYAALVQKLPLRKILTELGEVTGEKIRALNVQGLEKPMQPGFRHGTPKGIGKTIVVHSGKGGVGKTFVAVNLAAALACKGFKVGILDGDVDCPNVMEVLKLKGKMKADAEKKIVPLEKIFALAKGKSQQFGLKVVSMAPLLQQNDQPLMWRGPVISRVIEQFVHDVAWGELDYLVVDLPSGTGDAPLTLLNILDQPNFVAVTTSQELAQLDCKKSLGMAKKLNLKILGVIENMSGTIFGKGGGLKIAKEMSGTGAASRSAEGSEKSVKGKTGVKTVVPFLGAIDLKSEFAKLDIHGKPAVLRSKALAAVFNKIIGAMKL